MELSEIKEKICLIERRLALVQTIKKRLNARTRRAASNMHRRLQRGRKVRDI